MKTKLNELIEQLEAEASKEGLISVSEAATIRDKKRSGIWQLIQRGRLDSVTVLGRTYVFKDQIENFTKMKPGPALGTIFKKK